MLCTAVTDYATAKGVSEGWTGMTGINVSSTSDRVSLDAQAAMIKELLRETKKVGQLYCPAEPNSGYQFTVISGHLKD